MENFLIHDNLSVNDKGHLCLNGHDCVTLAQNFGTPLYLIDEDKVREMCRTYKRACEKYFEKANVLYASKALSFKGIYKVVQEEGVFADAVSVGEIYTALRAGFDAKNLYFHGNAKTKQDIEFAIENGIGCIIADNFTELCNIDAFCASKGIKQDILLRITPGIDCHTHEKISTGKVDSKFGVSIETGQAIEFVKAALECENVNLLGLHCHVGSQAFEAQPFTDGADIMFAFLKEIKDKFSFECKILNLGGGFGVRYKNNEQNLDIDKMMSIIGKNVRDNCQKYGLSIPEILFEPGRSLVAAAGTTLYSVVNVKNITGYKNYIAVDGGMADNPRYALYEAPYTCVIANRMNEKADFTADVVGRCCESGDIIQPSVSIQNAKEDDILATLVTGAYNYSMASNYNRLTRPALLMLTKDKVKVGIRRETLSDLIKNDE